MQFEAKATPWTLQQPWYDRRMVAKIPIANEDGMVALVDDDLAKSAMCFRWALSDKGEPKTQYPHPDNPKMYTSITLKAWVMLERVESPWVIKNLNGDPLDCRRENLAKMTLKEARALDVKNFGPRVRAKKSQGWRSDKILGRQVKEPKPPKPPRLKIFP